MTAGCCDACWSFDAPPSKRFLIRAKFKPVFTIFGFLLATAGLCWGMAAWMTGAAGAAGAAAAGAPPTS